MNPALPSDFTSTGLQEACPSTGWKARIARQFGKPEGRLGYLVGRTMAWKNKSRSEWVLSLLEIEPVDRIVEIGFGSGQDLRRVNALAKEGLTAGVDHSQEMVKMARAKNLAAILAGRADIRYGLATQIPFAAETFTKAFSINSIQFWLDRRAALQEIQRVLRPGGLVAIGLEPRGAATRETALANGQTIVAELEIVGFQSLRLETSDFGRVPTICALGCKAG